MLYHTLLSMTGPLDDSWSELDYTASREACVTPRLGKRREDIRPYGTAGDPMGRGAYASGVKVLWVYANGLGESVMGESSGWRDMCENGEGPGGCNSVGRETTGCPMTRGVGDMGGMGLYGRSASAQREASVSAWRSIHNTQVAGHAYEP
ncbi:hypothetical protein Tco_0013199 [Tanacetum coccineum]